MRCLSHPAQISMTCFCTLWFRNNEKIIRNLYGNCKAQRVPNELSSNSYIKTTHSYKHFINLTHTQKKNKLFKLSSINFGLVVEANHSRSGNHCKCGIVVHNKRDSICIYIYITYITNNVFKGREESTLWTQSLCAALHRTNE